MKKEITQTEFINDIQEIRPNNFTYEGLCYLFEWFEEYEKDTDTQIDYDPIAICCEFIEYTDVDEVIDAYGILDIDELQGATLKEKCDAVREYLEDRTIVVAFDYCAQDADDRDTILFAQF